MTPTKRTKFHHSVTENGKIQVRLVTEYFKDGQLIEKKYDDPVTPADTNDMTGWDDRSKNIVATITDEKVLADFAVEKQEPTGTGLEKIVTFDRVVEEDGKIAVRRITRIFDEGKEISKKYHRSWIMPGDNSADFDIMSKAIAQKLHTPEVISEYNASLAIIGK